MNVFLFFKTYGLWFAQSIIEDEDYLYLNIDTIAKKMKYSNVKNENSIAFDEIKRIIESHRIVNLNGGLVQARKISNENKRTHHIKDILYDAILDVEKCINA